MQALIKEIQNENSVSILSWEVSTAMTAPDYTGALNFCHIYTALKICTSLA